jgi:hypothetical protein
MITPTEALQLAKEHPRTIEQLAQINDLITAAAKAGETHVNLTFTPYGAVIKSLREAKFGAGYLFNPDHPEIKYSIWWTNPSTARP